MAAELLKSEFALHNLKCHYHAPEHFVQSQWQRDPYSYYHLAYRWAMAIFFFGLVVGSWSEQEPEIVEQWLIYLTHWGITLCMAVTILGAILTTEWTLRSRNPDFTPEYDGRMPALYKAYWVMHTASPVVAIGITMIYWSVLYKPGYPIDTTNVLTHAMNSVFMLLDVGVSKHPVRLLHAYQPIIFTFIYLIFSLIYYLAGGLDKYGNPYVYNILDWHNVDTCMIVTFGVIVVLFGNPYVYNILDWRDVGTCMIVTFGGIVVLIVIHSFVFGLYRLRVCVNHKLQERHDRKWRLPETLEVAESHATKLGRDNEAFHVERGEKY